MSDLLKGKAAVVTGGGGQLGKVTALALAREGVKVVVNDVGVGPGSMGVSKGPADEVVEEIKKAGGS